MEKLKEMLTAKFPDVDFENSSSLVSDKILDSLSVVSIISEIEDMFDISVSMEYIQPKYFESIDAMWDMIEELK